MTNALVLGPHPDDPEIFAGGTIAQLVDAGHKVIVVIATDGALGKAGEDVDVARERQAEATAAAEILGVSDIEFLGYRDSGYSRSNLPADAFARIDIKSAAQNLAEIMRRHSITSAFFDDDHGIYGHPDHVTSHRVGYYASQLAGLNEAYRISFDTEQAHWQLVTERERELNALLDDEHKEYHIVLEAYRGLGLSEEQLSAIELGSGYDLPDLGLPSIEITDYVELSANALDRKRRALEAHVTQMPPGILKLPDDVFRTVYGMEYFARVNGLCTVEREKGILYDLSR